MLSVTTLFLVLCFVDKTQQESTHYYMSRTSTLHSSGCRRLHRYFSQLIGSLSLLGDSLCLNTALSCRDKDPCAGNGVSSQEAIMRPSWSASRNMAQTQSKTGYFALFNSYTRYNVFQAHLSSIFPFTTMIPSLYVSRPFVSFGTSQYTMVL